MSTVVTGINGPVKTTTFTSSDTWYKDERTASIMVFGWGGGSGGGSGRQGASAHAGGGSGGGNGGCFKYSGPTSFFGSTESVVVGLGGTGGAAQTSADTNGNDGTEGGNSTFGYLNTFTWGGQPSLGKGGIDGSTAKSYGRSIFTDSLTSPTVIEGAGVPASPNTFAAGTGSLTAGGDAAGDEGGVRNSFMTPTSGGGGAGANSGTEYAGGSGGGVVNLNIPSAYSYILARADGGVESGVINGDDGLDYVTSGGIITGGGGGAGGGGQKAGLVAGNGGKGGFPGGGGGGGGGSLNGTNSGTGGNGGDGLVVVIEFFG